MLVPGNRGDVHTAVEWLKESVFLRNMADDLLLTTDHRISDIAAMVGFEDSGYFTRLFRKGKGVPPAEFRKKI